MKYKIIDDLTSDVMFEARGRDLAEAFENAAEAMFSVICKLDEVSGKKSLEIAVRGKNKEELMINWLQELIGLVDTEGMFFSKFKILEIDDNHLKAKISGERISPEKEETVVKAVTYHNFSFRKTKRGYIVRTVLDI